MKKFISIAVAGVVGAVGFASVAAADVTVYGRVTAGAIYADDDTATQDGAWNFGATGIDGSHAHVAGTRFGFRGSQDLGSGMEAGFQIERAIREGERRSATQQRQNNVWLSGGWGKLTLGMQNNPYMSARNWDQTYLYGGNWGASYRHEGIGYSMSSGAFSLNVLATANSEENAVITPATAGTTVHYYTAAPASGATRITATGATDPNHVPGVPLFIELDAMGNPTTAQNACTTASATCALGYTLDTMPDTNPADAGPSSLTRTGTNGTPAVTDDSNGVDSWIARVGYDFGVAAVNVAVHTDQTESTTGRDRTAIGVNGSVGPLDWYLAYETSELANAPAGGDNDIDAVGGFLGFSASEKDTIYAYHVAYSADVASATLGEDYTETILGYSRDMGPGVRFIAEYQSLDLDLVGNDAGSDPSKLALVVRYVF